MSDRDVYLTEVWDGNVVTYTVSEICEVAVKDDVGKADSRAAQRLGMSKCGQPATHRYDRERDSWPVCVEHAALMAQHLNRHDVGNLVPLEPQR
jgi:hypothetical protein